MDTEASFEGDVRHAYDNQIDYCEKNGAPITARIVRAVRELLDREDMGSFMQRISHWPGRALADGLPLRSAGALRRLYLGGGAPALEPIYSGHPADDLQIVGQIAKAHAAKLLPWLDGPPQTNEAGRSSGFVAAMLWLAQQGLPPIFEPLEIGASAGINLMMDRYRWDLGGVIVGSDHPAISLAPEWRGPSPPAEPITLMQPKGCDIAPLDLRKPEEALRLKAFIWPEHIERFARLEAAIAAAHVDPPRLVKMTAAEFVEGQLREPQEEGTTRVLMHSIVWQYLSDDEKQRITAAMEGAGARASTDKALAWISLEADRTALGHLLKVRYWPGSPTSQLLAHAHAHGAWIEWLDVG